MLYLHTQVQANASEQFYHRPAPDQEHLEVIPDLRLLCQSQLEVSSHNELLLSRIFRVLSRQVLQVKRDI